jgi:uncharacterized protein
MKRVACVAFVLVAALLGHPALAERQAPKDPVDKERDIRRFLVLSGAAKVGEQVLDSMIDMQSRTLPQVPAEFWRELRGSMSGAEMVEMVVPIYDKYLSHEEVLAIVAFYESPAGRHLAEVQPQITQESMVVGQEWGRRAAERIMSKLRERGYR